MKGLKVTIRFIFVIAVVSLSFEIWFAFRAWATYAEAIFFLILLLLGALLWTRRIVLKHGRDIYAFFRSVSQSIKGAVAADPEVKKLVARIPALFSFLKRRFDRAHFSGFPLTLLSILFIYVFGLFVGIVEDILVSDPIVAVDVRLEHLFAAFRSPRLVDLSLWFTLLGKANIVIAFALASSGVLFLLKKRSYILPLWISLGGSAGTAWLGKFAFHRPRPDGSLSVYLEKSFSFPSGHSTAAVAFYGFIVVVLWREIKNWPARINILFAGLATFFTIGLSRLYLGVHYLSDVIGGFLIGWLWLIIAVSIHGWSARKDELSRLRPTRGVAIASLLLMFASAIYFIQYGVRYEPSETSPVHPSQRIIRTDDVLSEFAHGGLPRQTETLTGDKQEPLSFIFVAQDDERLKLDLEKSGWLLADQVSTQSLLKLIEALALDRQYARAPMTPSFWNGSVHNFGFEKSAGIASPRIRHHLRIWKTGVERKDGQSVYVGTASFDAGSQWGIIHRIDASIDKERDLLFQDLRGSGAVDHFSKVQFVDSMYGTNFLKDPFYTDGSLYFVYLKSGTN